ncbi:MAG: hypothetical protein KIS92_23320 [Planctomycetota bacterium]|nr:hypothetical protein [Planctomycetota bacterium]
MNAPAHDRGAAAHAAAGGACFLAAALLSSALWLFVTVMSDPELLQHRSLRFHALRSAYTGIPIAAFIGMLAGWMTFYRRWPRLQFLHAKHAVLEQVLSFVRAIGFMILMFVFFGIFPLFLLCAAQLAVRSYLMAGHAAARAAGKPLAALLILIYLAGGQALGRMALSHSLFQTGQDIAFAFVAILLCALGMGDCFLALLASRWKHDGRIPEPPAKYQFSLGAFVAVVMLLRLWCAGLLPFYRT